MSASPENVVAGGSGPPVAWWSAASPVGGDVVLCSVVLLFIALALAFVLYHNSTATVSRRGGGAGVGAAPTSAQQHQQHGTLGRGRDATGGLDPSVLRALPVTVYEAKDDHRAGEALECAVCLAELADGEPARFLPRCAHGFHAECIDQWLRGHSTCPLCRVDVGLLPAPAPAPPSSALPPALPAPATYPTDLPTNVLFWGSQGAVTVARAAVRSGPSAPRGAPPPLVIHVRETAPAPPPPPPPREGGAAKAEGLARLSSLRRLWSRGRHDDAAAATSRSCRRATATATA